eukprot:TRINITY_DN4717_c1_g1_i1.p1 TRINITY_DN4717_c1_g1~~TRINITY_DN4717_c1_g1_i1.p1  ORF type:complete len:502 (+),score=46.48 TRINITY_DN4717_c1_g1_i1:87-1592(+)
MTNSFRWVLNKLGIKKKAAARSPSASGELEVDEAESEGSSEEGVGREERIGLRRIVEGRLEVGEGVWGVGKALDVLVATFNVGEKLPSFTNHDPLRAWLHSTPTPPDIYAIGLQEIEMTVASIILESPSSKGAIWAAFIESLVQERGEYTALEPSSIGGLLLLVFVNQKHAIHSISSSFVRIGYQGNLANKGAAALRVSLLGRSILFINSHLEAHENRGHERNEGYACILHELCFSEPCPRISDLILNADEDEQILSLEIDQPQCVLHEVDYAFWFGDLNYRLVAPVGASRDGGYQQLLKHDELKQMLASDQAFSGWKEGLITFPPTYKYELNSNLFSEKRRPAWTDRILYFERPRAGISINVLPPASHLLPPTHAHHQQQNGISPVTHESFFSCIEKCKGSPAVSRRPSVITIPSPPASPPPEPTPSSHYITHLEGSYNSYPVTLSDHRPVSAAFKIGCVTPDPTKAREYISNDEEIQQRLRLVSLSRSESRRKKAASFA